MTTLDDKISDLFSRTGGHTIKFGLDTVRALLAEMDVDPLGLPCVHIAGTNGKGSTAAMLAAICQASGLRTALYTSPHIFRFNERIQIDGVPIADQDLSALIDLAVEADARQAAATPQSRPATFFELTTAIAFRYFLDRHVHLAILETGMGGRLDATNVVDPIASVITPLGLEHTDYLGPTLKHIAAEKGGIVKPGRPLILATPQPPEALEVLLGIAAERHAPVIMAGDRVAIRASRSRTDAVGQTLHIQMPDADLPPVHLPLCGAFQMQNAATAVAAALYLRSVGLPVTDAAIVDGLSNVRWPGRLQKIGDAPPTYLDVGHNPHAAAALVPALKAIKGKRPLVLLCGLLSDKDALAYFRALRPVVARALLVPLPTPRNTPIKTLLSAAQTAGLPAEAVSPETALPDARALAADLGAVLLLAGSFHLPEAIGLASAP